jgi:cell wall-associated NlpC family hydrolase
LIVILVSFVISSCAGGGKARLNKVNTVIQTARSYTGVPYKYGGTTRSGIDCSALLYHAFNSVNVTLPRVSKDQAKEGEKVRLKDLIVGDMVFFATGNRKNEITHAGIVTAVNGKRDVRFIHASTKLGVTESNLYSTYYIQRFKRARRVL